MESDEHGTLYEHVVDGDLMQIIKPNYPNRVPIRRHYLTRDYMTENSIIVL